VYCRSRLNSGHRDKLGYNRIHLIRRKNLKLKIRITFNRGSKRTTITLSKVDHREKTFLSRILISSVVKS
jgi:hypothetical protein